MTAQITLHLPSLQTEVTGVLDQGIALFRALPYATLNKRWTHSRKADSLPSPFDATEYGPRCSQGEGQVLVTGGVTDPTPGDDEFKCLHLNVAVPQEALHNGSSLPVMVWIHGGAFNYGCNSVARYRPLPLSLTAKADGNPMVLVQIQYRLGPLGFAASEDLATEQQQTNGHQNGNSEPLLGNFGLVDQIHALEWVRDHIKDFGGNPADVTAFGVSAGSASIHHHILTGSPLFDRAILMSGCAPTLGPLPSHLYEQAWQNFIKRAGITASTPSERLEELRALSAEEVINNYTSAPMGPMADGTLLPTCWAYKEKQPPTRCKSIIIGDTQVEAIIMDSLIKAHPQPKFEPIARATTKDSTGLLHAFNITPAMHPTAYLHSMRTLLSVGMFQHSNLLVATTFPGPVYYYHFDEPSPYPGPTFGIPYHGQCALFAHLNGIADYPHEARRTAETMARVWTAFASGKVPWEEYGEAGRFMRLGPEGSSSMQSWESDEVRLYNWKPWVAENFEDLMKITRDLTVKV